MRQAVPILCMTQDKRPRAGVAWTTVDIREVTAAEAPFCVQGPHVEFRNFDGRYWLPANHKLGPTTTDLTKAQQIELLNQFNGNYHGHPLYPKRYDFDLIAKRARTDRPITENELQASPIRAAIEARAKSMILVDGKPWIESAGPVLQAHPGTKDGLLRWTSSPYALSHDYKSRLYAFGLGQEEMAIETASAGLGIKHYISPTGAPEIIGELPAQTWLFEAGALEMTAWNVGWCLSEAKLQDAGDWRAEALIILRKALEGRADLSALTRGKLYLYDSWPYDSDTLSFQDPADLARAIEEVIRIRPRGDDHFDTWLMAAQARIQHGMTRSTIPDEDLDAVVLPAMR